MFGRIFSVFMAALSLAYADTDALRDPWRDTVIGDWVIVEETTVDGDGKNAEQRKIVRSDAVGEGISLSIYPGENGIFADQPLSVSQHVPGLSPDGARGFKLVDRSEENLEIDGQSYPCQVYAYSFSQGRMMTVRLKLWRVPGWDLPYRELQASGKDVAMGPDVVRLEYSIEAGRLEESYTMQVQSLQEALVIGERSITCVYEEGTARVRKNGKLMVAGDLKRWLSNEIPGGEAQVISNANFDGQAVQHIERVVDFGRVEVTE